jgi:hypothetical protein
MTGQLPGRAGFDELAAGYAVHALEPADEQRFLRRGGSGSRPGRLGRSGGGRGWFAAVTSGVRAPALLRAGLC